MLSQQLKRAAKSCSMGIGAIALPTCHASSTLTLLSDPACCTSSPLFRCCSPSACTHYPGTLPLEALRAPKHADATSRIHTHTCIPMYQTSVTIQCQHAQFVEVALVLMGWCCRQIPHGCLPCPVLDVSRHAGSAFVSLLKLFLCHCAGRWRPRTR